MKFTNFTDYKNKFKLTLTDKPVVTPPSFGGTGGGGGGGISGGVITGTPIDNTVTQRFSDVPLEHWSYEYVEALFLAGIITGYPDGSFAPENSVTRAEFTKMLLAALGINISDSTDDYFSDVTKDDWFAPYVNTAKKMGIVSGISETEFAPNMEITREQMMVIALNSLKSLDIAIETTPNTTFSDAEEISDWALTAVATMQRHAIMNGSDGKAYPKATAKRSEAAKIIKLIKDFTLRVSLSQ